jgi:enoyl-CoA hydratase/carnithine racemase
MCNLIKSEYIYVGGGNKLKYINAEFQDQILTITLNNPERNNPLSQELCRDLIDTLRKAEKDPAISAIVLTGSGKSFCAGADIKEFSEKLSQSTVTVYEDGNLSTAELFRLGTNYTKPIIGAVNGYALAGGFGLACLCHIVFASDRAKFGITEINIGMFPMVILPLVRKVIGERKALELSLTAQILNAEEAREIGVVNYVVAHENLLRDTKEFVENLVKRSPVAVKMGLTAYNDTYLMDSSKAIDYLNALRVINFKSKDLYEGSQAFLEKREPIWLGE